MRAGRNRIPDPPLTTFTRSEQACFLPWSLNGPNECESKGRLRAPSPPPMNLRGAGGPGPE